MLDYYIVIYIWEIINNFSLIKLLHTNIRLTNPVLSQNVFKTYYIYIENIIHESHVLIRM